MDKIELNTYDDNKIFKLELLYKVENYYTFDFFIKSWEFSWKSSLCFSIVELNKLEKSLETFIDTLNWEFILKDSDSDAYIMFVVENGKVIIKWQVWWSHQDHYMKYKFITDQTTLKPFYSQLKSLL